MSITFESIKLLIEKWKIGNVCLLILSLLVILYKYLDHILYSLQQDIVSLVKILKNRILINKIQL